MEWKVGTCSGHHKTALSGGEGARSQQYLILRYTNHPRYTVGGEAGHGALEHIKANGIGRPEIRDVKLFGEDDVQDACQKVARAAWRESGFHSEYRLVGAGTRKTTHT